MSFSLYHTLRKPTFTLIATTITLISMMCFHAKGSDSSNNIYTMHNENIQHLNDVNSPFLNPEILDQNQLSIIPAEKSTLKSLTGRQKIYLYVPTALGFTLQSFSQFFYALSAHSEQSLELCTATLNARGGRCFSNRIGDTFAVLSVISYAITIAYCCYLGYLHGFYLGDIYLCGGSKTDQD